MIKVQRLGKRYGKHSVFRRLDFVWDSPGIICLNGANGSGKTTLLTMLAGALPPDHGDIFVRGQSLIHNHDTAVGLIAYVPDSCPVYPFISGQEWLAFTKSLRPFDLMVEQQLLSDFGLLPHLNCRFDAMSFGTARKFLLTSALSSKTPIIILDEPSNGLDDSSFAALCHHLAKRKTEHLIVLSCQDPMQRRQLDAESLELSSLESL